MKTLRFLVGIVLILSLCVIPTSAQLVCSGGMCPGTVSGALTVTGLLTPSGGVTGLPAGSIGTPSLAYGTNAGLYSPGSGGSCVSDLTRCLVAWDNSDQYMLSTMILGWSSSSASAWAAANDTGFSRLSPGLLALGNGTSNSITGRLSAAGYVGTITNNNATTGDYGEYVTSQVASGSAVSTATGSATPITSMVLTAGDWNVYGVVDYVAASTTSVTILIHGSSSVANCMVAPALGAQDSSTTFEISANILGNAANPSFDIPEFRYSVASTTTVCLVTKPTFTASTLKAYGTISARRMR